jgi:hypothetical protein
MTTPAITEKFNLMSDDSFIGQMVNKVAGFMGYDENAPAHESYNNIAAGVVGSAVASMVGAQFGGGLGMLVGGALGNFLNHYGDEIAEAVENVTGFNLEKNFAPTTAVVP